VVIGNLVKEIIRSNYVNFNEFMCRFVAENDENHKQLVQTPVLMQLN
jgi:hypothetical protein